MTIKLVEELCSSQLLKSAIRMGNASSVKGVQQLDRKSTATDVTDRYGGAAIGKHVIVTGKAGRVLLLQGVC